MKHNDTLRLLVDAAIPMLKRHAEQAGLEWSKIQQTRVEERTRTFAKMIGSRWRRGGETK